MDKNASPSLVSFQSDERLFFILFFPFFSQFFSQSPILLPNAVGLSTL